MLQKKIIILSIAFVFFLLSAGGGAHYLISLGVKSYLTAHLPKGENLAFSYENSQWEKGNWVFHNATIKSQAETKNLRFSVDIDDLKISCKIQLFPFKLIPKVTINRPQVSLMDQDDKGDNRNLYKLIHHYLLTTSLNIKEGEIVRGDQRIFFTFMHFEETKEGILKIGKKKESYSITAICTQKSHSLKYDLNFEHLDMSWACAIGSFFLPQLKNQWKLEQGILQGDVALSFNPSFCLDHVKYDLSLYDCNLHHQRYGLTVGIDHLEWKNDCSSNDRIPYEGASPTFEPTWVHFLGHGKIAGLEISIKDCDSNQGWYFSDIKGSFCYTNPNRSLIELDGNEHASGQIVPFHLIGKRTMDSTNCSPINLDVHIFSQGESSIDLALVPQDSHRLFCKASCQNLNPKQLRLLQYFASQSIPLLNKIAVEQISFTGKGVGYFENGQFTHLTLSHINATDVIVFFPSTSLIGKATHVLGKGNFDFSKPDFYDGNCWEVAVSNGEIAFQEKESVQKIDLFYRWKIITSNPLS